MFAPTKVYRRWHRHINVNQRRYALCAAVAASGIPALVLSKGHAIEQIPEVPLVVSDKIQEYKKTKQAVTLLRKLGAWADIEKVYKSKRMRPGKGKLRNRRRLQRKGPLIIYGEDNGLTRAFRNIPGVDTIWVDHLNLLRMAPGGHVGRFCIWTECAFRKLDAIYGSTTKMSQFKKDYHLPLPQMTCTDIGRLLKSEEIRRAVRPMKKPNVIRVTKHKNPLKNFELMRKLNPFAAVQRRRTVLNNERLKKARQAAREAARASGIPNVVTKKMVKKANRKVKLQKRKVDDERKKAKKAAAVPKKAAAPAPKKAASPKK